MFVPKKFMKYLYDRYEYILISVIFPLCWPAFKEFFKLMSKGSSLAVPVKHMYYSATILLGEEGNPGEQVLKAWKKVRKSADPAKLSLIHPEAAKHWAISTLKIHQVHYSNNSKKIDSQIVIITGDWLKLKRPHLKLFIPVFIAAYQIRKQKLPVWFMQGDAFRLETLIAASIFVSICGGAVVLQMQTAEEGSKFGIPFPSGPHIWTLSLGNSYLFESNSEWKHRQNNILFAVSGDGKRKMLYNKYSKVLEGQKWTVYGTNQQYDWNDYCELNRCAKINITTSLMQEAYLKKLRHLRRNVPKHTVTHRVWEGFCSGSLVVTNKNPVLESLGFIENVHYLDLDLLISTGFVFPENQILNEIADIGKKRFFEILQN